MKRIILHCGLPKTGTSALQVQLAQSRTALMDAGFDYLQTGDFNLGAQGKIGSGNGVGLAWAYLPPQHEASQAGRRIELTEKFLETIRAAKAHVILSSEFFGAIPVPLMRDLVAELSREGEVQLVYFVREQLNFMASSFVQRVKRHGLQQYPDEFFANWDSFKSAILYHALFERVQAACPSATLMAKPYELSRNHAQGLMGLFLDMIGADLPKQAIAPDRPVNLSPSPKEIRLMIELNRHRPRAKFSDMVVEASARAGRSRIHSDHVILPPAFREEVKAYFREDNRLFFERFVGGENLYESAGETSDFIDLREISFDATDVIDITSGILVDLDLRLAKLEG